MRRRIWCELLPPETLGEDATIAVLKRFGLEPIVALPPDKETDAMFAALAKLYARGIKVGVWPLLSDEEGYWPSLHNADAFARRISALLPLLEARAIKVSTLAFDLEPPLDLSKRLLDGGGGERVKAMFHGLVDLARTAEPPGARTIAELDQKLRAQGIETLAAVMPNLILDLASGSMFWERVFKTPCAITEWSVVSPMVYTTMLAASLPSRSMESARSILYEGARLLVEAVGTARASLSLGLVTTGKHGNEPFFDSPEELRFDVETARAGGVDDFALFSLEGVLTRGSPETWLLPYTQAEARAPRGLRSRVVSSLVRGIARASTPLGWIR
jgi:hypothetical protein